MQPVAEMVEWAAELGIDVAGSRPWKWFGNNTVLKKGGLRVGCLCRFPHSLAGQPPLAGIFEIPSGEVELMRFGESDYMVGQCEGCKLIIWAMEVVQGGEES